MPLIAVEYTMTIAIGNNHQDSGSTDPQYVTIKGTLGETEEKRCDADFTRRGEEVTCTVNSEVYIGSYRCVRWRTGGDNGWDLDKVGIQGYTLPNFKILQFSKILTIF